MKHTATFLLITCLWLGLGALAYGQSLNLEKYNFQPNEEIKVKFKAGAGFDSSAWIGIIPSNVKHGSEAENDKHDLAYQYLKNRASGVLTFKAPAAPGLYDFRMNTSDSSGKEVAHITFIVGKGTYFLKLEKKVFSPGEDIPVTFKAGAGFADNAWIGIIPSHVEHGSESVNDQHDVAYQYLRKKPEGTLVFKAPAKPGKYDFRMHDTDSSGKEVSFISFEVK